MVRKPQSDATPFSPAFDKAVREASQRFHVPSITFAVVDGNKTWSKAYGLAQIDEHKPATPSTLYYVGSTTKAQLCLVWALYIDSDDNKNEYGEKKITFSTPLVDIIRDDFVLQDPTITHMITLEDAFSHRTGQHSYDNSYGWPGIRTQKALVRNLRNVPVSPRLRTQFEYCNTMYVAASHALEVVTGKPLGEILREWLWTPLGLTSTYAGYNEAKKAVQTGSTLAYGYTWSKLYSDDDHDSGKQQCNGHMDFPEVGGAGYVISTVEDYARWMRCWLSSSAPLTSSLRQELWTPRSIDLDPSVGPYESDKLYCLGWWKVRAYNKDVFFHSGGLIGAGALVVLIPDINFGVTFFANSAACGATLASLSWYLVEQKLGITEEIRLENFHSRNEQVIARYALNEEKYLNSRRQLFPHTPKQPRIPSALNIKGYTGLYKHPGYGTIRFELAHDVDGEFLLCSINDRTWPRTVHLRHVTAEHWFCTIWFSNSPTRTGARAETRVGADGKVKSISLGLEDEDELLHFERYHGDEKDRATVIVQDAVA